MIKKNEDYEILENLKKLVGEVFYDEDIILCFPCEQYVVVDKIEGTFSNYDGHGACQLWNAYYNEPDATLFGFYVDEDNIIVEVHWEV